MLAVKVPLSSHRTTHRVFYTRITSIVIAGLTNSGLAVVALVMDQEKDTTEGFCSAMCCVTF